jgi:hypothetical protein
MENQLHMKPKKSRVVAVAGAALLLLPLLYLRAYGQSAAKPLSKEDIRVLLKGDVSPKRVADMARERKTDFEVTLEVEQDLKAAGADDNLLEVLREVAPKPSSLPTPKQGAQTQPEFAPVPQTKTTPTLQTYFSVVNTRAFHANSLPLPPKYAFLLKKKPLPSGKLTVGSEGVRYDAEEGHVDRGDSFAVPCSRVQYERREHESERGPFWVLILVDGNGYVFESQQAPQIIEALKSACPESGPSTGSKDASGLGQTNPEVVPVPQTKTSPIPQSYFSVANIGGFETGSLPLPSKYRRWLYKTVPSGKLTVGSEGVRYDALQGRVGPEMRFSVPCDRVQYGTKEHKSKRGPFQVLMLVGGNGYVFESEQAPQIIEALKSACPASAR